MIGNFQDLVSKAGSLPQKTILVVYPTNDETISAVVGAQKSLNARCILVGKREVIAAGLTKLGGDLSLVVIQDADGVQQALDVSMSLAANGEVDVLMKGSVDTSTMMKAALKESSGLRTGRLLSDIFVLEYPIRSENKFVMITDGGLTLAPTLQEKIELVNNAVEVAHSLGNMNPKVAILSATEFVLLNLPSTTEAAILSKMNERGQIKGCTIDGPLALDNALSPAAASEKGLTSPVAGKAEILVAHNIEAANSLAKSTTYFANLPLAHVIVGAGVPILIPSRADTAEAKLYSIALGMLMSEQAKRK